MVKTKTRPTIKLITCLFSSLLLLTSMQVWAGCVSGQLCDATANSSVDTTIPITINGNSSTQSADLLDVHQYPGGPLLFAVDPSGATVDNRPCAPQFTRAAPHYCAYTGDPLSGGEVLRVLIQSTRKSGTVTRDDYVDNTCEPSAAILGATNVKWVHLSISVWIHATDTVQLDAAEGHSWGTDNYCTAVTSGGRDEYYEAVPITYTGEVSRGHGYTRFVPTNSSGQFYGSSASYSSGPVATPYEVLFVVVGYID